MDSFATGRGILAADLNRLASDAARRGLAGSAYLAHSNGFELVQRNPRRGPARRGVAGAAGAGVATLPRIQAAPLLASVRLADGTRLTRQTVVPIDLADGEADSSGGPYECVVVAVARFAAAVSEGGEG